MGKSQQLFDYLRQEGIPINLTYLPTTANSERGRDKSKAIAEEDVSLDVIARAALLQSHAGLIMAVFPASHMLDYKMLAAVTGAKLAPVNPEHYEALNLITFSQLDLLPAVPNAYGLEAIVSTALTQCEDLYINPGEKDQLLQLTQSDFMNVVGDCVFADLSIPRSQMRVRDDSTVTQYSDDMAGKQVLDFMTRRVQQRLQAIDEIPVISATGRDLLQLHADPHAEIRHLADIVKRDPSLAAQIVSWARSPFYGFSGKVETIEDAIIKVLGYDLVMNLSLGLALSQSLSMPAEGPFGQKAYWQSAFYSATLMQTIAAKSPVFMGSNAGTLYLAGLLHNFGLLVMGQAFPQEFQLLTNNLIMNTHIPMADLQEHVIGISYESIGAWLLQRWLLSEQVSLVAAYHTQENYLGPEKELVHLTLITNRLLKRIGIGFADSKILPARSLAILGVHELELTDALEQLLEQNETLQAIVNTMVS